MGTYSPRQVRGHTLPCCDMCAGPDTRCDRRLAAGVALASVVQRSASLRVMSARNTYMGDEGTAALAGAIEAVGASEARRLGRST